MNSAVPLVTSRDIESARRLIESQRLSFEVPFDNLIGIHEGGRLVATAARSGFVLKMFAIDEAYQGGALLGALATELVRLGRAEGQDTFFVFTRPEHAGAFEQLNFRLLASDGPVALLEFGGGLEAYLSAHAHLRRPGRNGAVVINGNPFTLGHLHLAETSAGQVDTLYLFVVTEDRSVFPFAVRYRLAAQSTSHLPNVVVLETSRYAVSAAVFPSYFLKQRDETALAQMRIDLRLFGAHLAPAFDITARFAGREPYCDTTAAYNQVMTEVLPEYGVALVEIPRRKDEHGFISATRVRDALARRDFDNLAALVPRPTLAFLRSAEGAAIAAVLAGQRGRD
jgi:[citrate (pro-3S)-lyase] ligase